MEFFTYLSECTCISVVHLWHAMIGRLAVCKNYSEKNAKSAVHICVSLCRLNFVRRCFPCWSTVFSLARQWTGGTSFRSSYDSSSRRSTLLLDLRPHPSLTKLHPLLPWYLSLRTPSALFSTPSCTFALSTDHAKNQSK